MHFVIEKELNDFSFHLIEAIKFQNWFLGDEKYIYSLHSKEYLSTSIGVVGIGFDRIPVGSIDFMKEYFKIYHPNVKLEPIKIDLFSDEVLGRKLFYQKGKILTKTCIVNKVFIKEHDFKGFRDALFLNPDELKLDNTEAEYLVSDLLDIASEYRCFVHRGKLVGMKHYLGNVYDIPNEKYVSKVISEFNKMRKRTTYSFDV